MKMTKFLAIFNTIMFLVSLQAILAGPVTAGAVGFAMIQLFFAGLMWTAVINRKKKDDDDTTKIS